MRGPYQVTRVLPASVATEKCIILSGQKSHPIQNGTTWVERYGDRHRMHRVVQFPPGISPPGKIRIYFRNGQFLLQWWEPTQGKNVAERVTGDLVEAVGRARQVETRLVSFRSSGRAASVNLSHQELVSSFLADLKQRADAGEIAPTSVSRYSSALAHYLTFTQTPAARRHRSAGLADRSFALALAAFLAERRVAANGLATATLRRMNGCAFVWDTVRAMFRWAADPIAGINLPKVFAILFWAAPASDRDMRRTLSDSQM